MTFSQRAGRRFIAIKAAKELMKEIEVVGIDDLITLANAGISIIETYLKSCTEEKKAYIKSSMKTLSRLGVTADMVLEETTRQMPHLRSIMDAKPEYRQSEVQRLEAFAKE